MSFSSGPAVRRALTPIDILRNCRGKSVSIELTNGETVNGIVMRTDRAMNIVLKQCIRTAAEGDTFWRARESLVRGASVRNVRMDEAVLKPTFTTGPHRRGGGGSGGAGKKRTRTPHAAGGGDEKPARKQTRK